MDCKLRLAMGLTFVTIVSGVTLVMIVTIVTPGVRAPQGSGAAKAARLVKRAHKD